MNGIEPLLAALIVYGIRDGILAWWLIHRLIGTGGAAHLAAPAPAAGPVPAPGPPPGPVDQPTAAAKPQPRFTGITATTFAGSNDSTFSRTSAYDHKIINGDTEFAAALPAPIRPNRLVRVFRSGRTADVPVRDKGPWNSRDPYFETGSRPQAETAFAAGGNDLSGRKLTNPAGLDLSPAVWKFFGCADPRNAEEKVDWDFVDVLDGAASASPQASGPAASGPAAPPWLVLIRKLRDVGVHAEHDSPIILSWPSAIATKFPEMADYAKGYQHDSTPWCGLTVAYVLAMSGIKPVFGPSDTDRFLWADAWRQFGTAVDAPQPGDVMVFRWAGGGEHVTLYDHEEDDAFYHCTGGNQGNSHVVSTEAMPMANCIAIRRPPVITQGTT
jgi:uncharacterized protein (TIGR02594 family)